MAGAQVATAVTIINSLLGFQAISLTNFTTSAESVIAAGSKVEVAGGFFTFASDETPNASSWTAVTTGGVAYITVIPAGSAGSQTITAEYTDTAPAWSDSKQGWYASAASLTRYVGGVYKSGATSYESAFFLPTRHGELCCVKCQIGEWDMDTDANKEVPVPGITRENVRSVSVIIFPDSAASDSRPLTYDVRGGDGSGGEEGSWMIDADGGVINLSRYGGGMFDSSSYDATAGTVANRGWVTVWFEL